MNASIIDLPELSRNSLPVESVQSPTEKKTCRIALLTFGIGWVVVALWRWVASWNFFVKRDIATKVKELNRLQSDFSNVITQNYRQSFERGRGEEIVQEVKKEFGVEEATPEVKQAIQKKLEEELSQRTEAEAERVVRNDLARQREKRGLLVTTDEGKKHVREVKKLKTLLETAFPTFSDAERAQILGVHIQSILRESDEILFKKFDSEYLLNLAGPMNEPSLGNFTLELVLKEKEKKFIATTLSFLYPKNVDPEKPLLLACIERKFTIDLSCPAASTLAFEIVDPPLPVEA